MSSSFFPADVETRLRVPPLRHVEFHSQIDSTNNRALAYVKENSPALPALILAEHQQAGRGRGSNRWWAGNGGLACSLIVPTTEFKLRPQQWPIVSLLTGLAICKVIETVLADGRHAVRLKWPNDVYLDGKKVCGILIEAPPGPEALLVIGIGINVNNSFADAPPEIQAIGTSIYDCLERYCDMTAFLAAVIDSLWHYLESLASYSSQLPSLWSGYCLLTGKQVTIETGPDRVTGLCRGMNAEGALLLETGALTKAFFGGTVIAFDDNQH